MKKLLLLMIMFLFSAFAVQSAGYLDLLNDVNDVMNVIDRTDYTINRVKNRVPKGAIDKGFPQSKTNTKSNSNTYRGNDDYYPQYQENSSSTVPTPQRYQENTVSDTPVPTGNYSYNQDRTYKGNAATLGELPAGVLLMDPTSVWDRRLHDNYSGSIEVSMPVVWMKLEDNHYTQGATLLLSAEEVAKYPFCHAQKGLRDWAESDVRRFLRTTFYNHLSTGFKNAIVNVNIPYADMSGKPKTILDNFFLLSIVEWGLSDRANNGTVIKYRDLPAIYTGRKMLITYNNIPGWYGGNGCDYTRTINRPVAESAGFTNDVFVIHPGTLNTVSASFGTPIRPAVNLKSTTRVKGPYEYKFAHDVKIIYYVLDFAS